MQITCENCFTVYDLSPEKSGMAGCPYCEHINKPKKGAASVQLGSAISKGLGVDPSKTMLNYIEGESKGEGSAVHKLIEGKVPALPAEKSWILTILEGDDKGKRFLLSKPVIRVGRKEVELVLRDPEVSRQQCVIQIYGEMAIIRDLKSANGTVVNGFVVKEDVLKDRDQIRVGNTVFQISLQPKK
ncbi:MAG: FHA domain-containing protein [Candidatus Manganitrophaceae bacterium]|nr:MAG: FHA domain-containing protein [Candidatus Manganitrophaceae bacterium]